MKEDVSVNFDTEKPNELPWGWVDAPFAQIFSVVTDGDHQPPPKVEEGVPFLVIGNIRTGNLDFTNTRFVSWDYYDGLQEYRKPAKGDMLYSIVGTIGIPVLVEDDRAFCVQRHIAILKTRSFPLPKYLKYALASHKVLKQALDCATGTAQKTVPLKGLRQVRVLVAPLPEQRRIVAEIEKQFTRLDAAVASLQRVKANLVRARASVLKAAVEGRLVPTEAELARAEGRDYEPASVLLERILEERKRKHHETNGKKKYKPPVEPDTDGLPDLPSGWAWANIEQLSTLIRNGYSKKPDDDGDTSILRISAVRPCSVDREDFRRLLASPSEFETATVFPGDLLFTRYNGTRSLVGVCGLLRGTTPIVYPDKLIRVVLVPKLVEGAFVEKAASAGKSRAFVERRIRTTAGQSGVSGSDIRQIPIPLPPLPEQRRIVVEVERHLSVLEALDASIETNLARCTRLRQSILKRAFEGKLVPQDPNDEPASELLARIQAETAAAPKRTAKERSTKKRSTKKSPRSKKSPA